MHPPRPLATALAASLLLATAGSAAHYGVEALPGDGFTAAVSPVGDADAYVVPLGTGARLSVEVRAAPGGNLLPTLAVRLKLAQDARLEPPPRLLVERVSHVLELPVALPAARHADEQTVVALDHLDVVDHEAAVEHDRDEGAQLLVRIGNTRTAARYKCCT